LPRPRQIVTLAAARWGCSSTGEHLACTEGVGGSNPLSSTSVFTSFSVLNRSVPSLAWSIDVALSVLPSITGEIAFRTCFPGKGCASPGDTSQCGTVSYPIREPDFVEVWQDMLPQAVLASSSRNRSTVHKVKPCGLSKRSQPSWSKKSTRRSSTILFQGEPGNHAVYPTRHARQSGESPSTVTLLGGTRPFRPGRRWRHSLHPRFPSGLLLGLTEFVQAGINGAESPQNPFRKGCGSGIAAAPGCIPPGKRSAIVRRVGAPG
jgi:hypothetical protein